MLKGTSTNSVLNNKLENQDIVSKLLKSSKVLSSSIWPDPKNLGLISDEVYKKQMELVKLAEKFGENSLKVKRLQIILLRSLNF